MGASRDAVAGLHISISEWRLDISLAGASTTAASVCDVSKGAQECNVEQDSDAAQESNATQAASQEHGADCVEDSGARNAFDSPDVGRDVQVVVVESCQVVGEDGEDESRAAEFNSADQRLEALEACTGEFAHDADCFLASMGGWSKY